MKPTFIAIQGDTCWIRPDQIEHIEPTYNGKNLVELEVCLLNSEHYTVDEPDDIKKITDLIEVI